MITSPTTGALATALAAAQATMGVGVERSRRGQVRGRSDYRYADLAACLEACGDALSSQGIAVLQSVEAAGDRLDVRTRLIHSSGEWIETGCVIAPVDLGDPQAYGSATTYGRRYGLCAAVGLAPVDDDGSHAAATVERQRSAPAPAAQRAAEPTSSRRPADVQPTTDDAWRAKARATISGCADLSELAVARLLALVDDPGATADAVRASFAAARRGIQEAP